MAGRVEGICGVEFAEPDTHVVRRATYYDTVVVVGEEYMLVDRVEAYNVFGVEARLYPLPATETPTIISILGLLGWIWERLKQGKRVLVEGSGGQGVVAAACLVSRGVPVGEAVSMVRREGMDIYSPLQLRLLTIIEGLVDSGVDVEEEASRFKPVAFSGGDAHTATVAEHAVEHALMLRNVLPVSPYTVYYAVMRPSKAPRLNEYEETLIGIARSLDSTLVGAVKSTYIGAEEGTLKVYIGCSLLMREGECWPEAMSADPYYRRLALQLGLRSVEYYMVDPEEAACRAYGYLDRDMCGGGLETSNRY